MSSYHKRWIQNLIEKLPFHREIDKDTKDFFGIRSHKNNLKIEMQKKEPRNENIFTELNKSNLNQHLKYDLFISIVMI